MLKLKLLVSLAAIVLTFTVGPARTEENIAIRDGNVTIAEAEMAAMIDAWTDDMRQAAARDKGERFELLTSAVMSRKMAKEAEAATPEDAGYWEMQFKILNIKQRYVFDRFIDQLDIPDFEDLARERYKTEKDKYAKVPEHRKASHILLSCRPGQCNREELRVRAEELLAQLRTGADFEAMVAEYSDDKNSKKRNGALTEWIRMGDPKVIPEFVGGLFEIEEVGGYSEVTDTRFGLHIIRMDEIAPSFYQPYDRVRDVIVKDLENEYKKLAAKEFREDYLLSDDAFIDGDIMDRLFAPYLPDDSDVDLSAKAGNPGVAEDSAEETVDSDSTDS
ncbi:MAG: peptidylprolyl isomerase [Chromatocurvus sp.]